MLKGIAGRITLNLIAGIVIAVVTVFAAILWMSQKQNDQATDSTLTMVVGGVEAMERRLQGFANDYGWWEEAYHAYVRRDADWMWANIGHSVQETNITELMAIISPEGELDYGWTLEDEVLTASDILTADAIAGIRSLMEGAKVESLGARSAYLRAGDGVMMIAVSHVTPVSEADSVDPATLPLFVAGFLLFDDRLAELGKSFLIDDLHLEPMQAGEPRFPGFPEITEISGEKIAQFVWTPPAPGFAVLRSVALPIALALSLFCIVAGATAMRARRMAMALARSEEEAVIAARTDGLTGMMNRTGFTELVDSEDYERLAEEGELAVIYVDINGFKAVNDSIGHHGGDDLVKALAQRVKSILPADSIFARIGGDEFAVAIAGKGACNRAAGAASAVVHSLDQPFTISGFEFHVTVAVGYALSGPGIGPNEVVRRADLAMYQAKNGAEREAVVYHTTMETGALEKKQVEAALRRAVEENELQVVYQPVVRASDLMVVGVEALVRWDSKEFGAISPAIFIPVAEETGLIHEIGKIVMRRACQDLANWPDLKMAVNISPVQLRDPNFADDLMAIVKRYGLSPHQFELELTEGLLVNNPTIAKRKLAMLKDLGFILSLDDFGTGFSSIGYLRQFPFDILKVDRSFVRDIGMNTTANALIQSLVSLGDAMNLSVIAEGIENTDQLRLLRLVQCEYLQGFLISRPIPAKEIDALLVSLGKERRIDLGTIDSDDRKASRTGRK